jgi:Tfp pilus assembly protein PilP
MKLTTGILAITITMAAGTVLAGQAVAQNADAIDNARSVAKSLEQKQEIQTNQALDAAGVPGTKPAPGAPAPAVKPAVIPGAAPIVMTSAPAAKPAASPKTADNAAAALHHNQLKKVNVVAGADSFRIELVSSEAVAGKASKLKSPDRVLVELPGTIAATRENHIAVGDGGIKGIRIGTDGKNPPTTSVVVDLEKACAYELTPGPAGTLVLTLHADALAKNNAPPAAKAPAAAPKPVANVAKTNPAPAPKPAPAAKTTTVAAKSAAPAKTVANNSSASKSAPPAAKQQEKLKAEAIAPQPDADADMFKPKPEDKKSEDKKWAMTGKRDPFFSPVVQQNGSGCSTGKKCLEIGNINLRGVVKSDSGFIAVVTNNLNKAYFLRENDPVFNGYVVKITGDSVVFQETVEDKLGKPFTREVVKRIFTPAV